MTINEIDNATQIILKGGDVLKPKTHSVRKIKMYCDMSRKLIPNPLAQWRDLAECHLQAGSLQISNDIEGVDADDDLR